LTVEHQRRHTAELLTTASCAAADELIAVDSRLYRCLFTTGDRIRQQRHGQADVRVRDESSGQVINVTLVGGMASGPGATIEALRHTGFRNCGRTYATPCSHEHACFSEPTSSRSTVRLDQWSCAA
jgi:hypothetical protein